LPSKILLFGYNLTISCYNHRRSELEFFNNSNKPLSENTTQRSIYPARDNES